eukprot:IDg6945t1
MCSVRPFFHAVKRLARPNAAHIWRKWWQNASCSSQSEETSEQLRDTANKNACDRKAAIATVRGSRYNLDNARQPRYNRETEQTERTWVCDRRCGVWRDVYADINSA